MPKNSSSSLQKWELVPLENIIGSTFTFAAYNMGYDSTNEVDTVYNNLKARGYYAVDWRDNKRIFCGGDRITAMSRYADILYINGHGGKRANVRVQRPGNSTVVQQFVADTNIPLDESKPSAGIGASWVDNENTDSIWDLYTKWVIFGACGQLNSYNAEYNDGEIWQGLTAAQCWARTMKSSGRRVHGFLGYYGLAANTDAHKDDLERFFDCSKTRCLPEAWAAALTPTNILGIGKRNWAYMVYESCRTDAMSQGRIFYTEPGPNDMIYYNSRAEGEWKFGNELLYAPSVLSATNNSSVTLQQNLN